MPTTISKLFNTGILQTLPELDEVSYTSIKLSSTNIYAAQFDEVSNPSITTYGSAVFDGSTQSLSIASSSVLNLGIRDYTIEFWWKPTVNTTSHVLDFYEPGQSSRLIIGANISTSNLEVYIRNSAGSVVGSINSGIPLSTLLNTWNHIALTDNNYTMTLWLNGVSVGTYTTAIQQSVSAMALSIMKDNTSGSANGSGNLTNVRIMIGTIGGGSAIYSTAFTPPTRPLTAITAGGVGPKLLLLMSTLERFLTDTSSNTLTVTDNGGVSWSSVSPSLLIPERRTSTGVYQVSGEFDEYSLNNMPVNGSALFVRASSQYLNQTVTQYSVSSTTFECWFRQNSTTGIQGLICARNSSTSTTGWDIAISGGTLIVTNNTLSTVVLTGGTVNINTWYHLAVVRTTGNIATVYLNGTSIGTFSRTSSTATGLFIGVRQTTSGEYFDGYISNFRHGTGTAYTANFTPPTSPLTAITGTRLLLNTLYGGGSNFLADTSVNAYTVTNTNGVTGASLNPF